MDSNYVGVIQGGGSLCLLNESIHAIAIASNFSRKNFQSNFAIEFHVLSQIHFAHSALANLRADFIAAEFCADGEGHFRWVILRWQSHALHKFREAWVRM